MLIKKKILYGLITLVLFSFLLLILLFISNQSKFIHLINKDSNFTFTYSENELLNKYLDNWKIVTNGKNSISQINVTFTSTPQAEYVMRDYVTKEMIQSYNWEKKNDQYNITIQLDPRYHNKLNTREQSLSANSAFIKALYFLSHPEQTNSDKIPQELLETFILFQKENSLPITVKNKK